MILNSPYISGSSTITGNLTVLGSISGSINSAISASYALNATSASYALNATSASYSNNSTNTLSASYAQTSSYADTFTVAGTLTAQKLVVQTITSSIVYSSGSNVFGNSLSNTQSMTGSVGITGSLSVNGVLTGTSATFTGNSGTSSTRLTLQGTGDGWNNQLITNTSGSLWLGVMRDDGIAPFTSGSAFASFLGSSNATSLILTTNATPRLTISSTGAATFSGGVTSRVNDGSAQFNAEPTTTTNSAYIQFLNSDGYGYIGKNSSAGGNLASGTSAYALVISTYKAGGTTAPIQFAPNNSIAATITSGGDVYIGDTTSITSTRLNVKSTVNRVTILTTTQTVGAAIEYYANTSTLVGYLGNGSFLTSGAAATDFILRSENALAFNTSGGSERMRITSAGNMYVGAAIDSASTSTFLSGFNGFGAKVSNNAYFLYSGLNSSDVRTFYVLGTGDVKNTNNSYGAISDFKLKENIKDATPKLDDLLKVKIRNYNLIGDDKKQIGIIAQELEEIFPAMVDELEDFEELEVPQIDEEGNEVLNEEGKVVTTKQRVSKGTATKSVKYSVFVPMLIKAIQEQQAQIEELKSLIK